MLHVFVEKLHALFLKPWFAFEDIFPLWKLIIFMMVEMYFLKGSKIRKPPGLFFRLGPSAFKVMPNLFMFENMEIYFIHRVSVSI